jgi:hypothetical protein
MVLGCTGAPNTASQRLLAHLQTTWRSGLTIRVDLDEPISA